MIKLTKAETLVVTRAGGGWGGCFTTKIEWSNDERRYDHRKERVGIGKEAKVEVLLNKASSCICDVVEAT